MTSNRRAAILLVVAAIVVSGIGYAAYVHEQNEAAMAADAGPAADASADARANVARAKAPTKKKGRGGKTQVTGRTKPAPTAHPTGTHASTPHSPAPPEDHAPDPPAPTVVHKHYGPPSGASYESALASNNREVAMGAHAGADLTDAQLHGPMSDGWFIGECDAPDSMSVTVKVAVKNGRAVGVSVSTSPHSADVAHCVDHHVRKLSWPPSPNMDSFVTTY